jgi:hypothetical protein
MSLRGTSRRELLTVCAARRLRLGPPYATSFVASLTGLMVQVANIPKKTVRDRGKT